MERGRGTQVRMGYPSGMCWKAAWQKPSAGTGSESKAVTELRRVNRRSWKGPEWRLLLCGSSVIRLQQLLECPEPLLATWPKMYHTFPQIRSTVRRWFDVSSSGLESEFLRLAGHQNPLGCFSNIAILRYPTSALEGVQESVWEKNIIFFFLQVTWRQLSSRWAFGSHSSRTLLRGPQAPRW